MPANASRLADLRQLLTSLGGDGFVIPRTDAYQGEYVALCDERLSWLTGFTGSAGMAIVLKEKAALFVDGRYTLQAQAQVDTSAYEICLSTDCPPCTWAKKHLEGGQKIFYDPWLHTLNDKTRGQNVCEAVGATFLPAPQNLIDKLWKDRPSPPKSPVQPHDLSYAGISSEEKRKLIATSLREKKADAALLTASESIAWLLNIRGNDVPHTPVAQGFALIWKDRTVDLFMDSSKVSTQVRNHLGPDVRLQDPLSLESWLSNLKEKAILIDPALTPLALLQQLENCTLLHSPDPCALPKAIKNPVEAQGAVLAHIQDGVAVTRFLAWLSKNALKGAVTEIDAAEKLFAFRKENKQLRDLSFETISGAGPNGAIVHYKVSPETNRPLELGSLYLVDSGGQYLNGTTDITRTVAIGTPTAEQKDRFTRVLKGHISLGKALFPVGTTGSQLDPLARYALWEAGLDYDHGTGHGVGSYLNVHEGPQRISKFPSTVALQPGMIISNEPGYYKTGAYGIRIESLVIVTEKGIPSGGERPLLGFETLTVVPIDRTLIEVKMLTEQERAWLNAYHKKVRETLTPLLSGDDVVWLKAATEEV
ncbi:MAG: aminopeptidase P family protein [Alphaproteobacteria bacterium]|jgi:Xaa-Pro aminopeptidase|nr:aminopeptidase P family protein [Alphaproteobacteria bacterium]